MANIQKQTVRTTVTSNPERSSCTAAGFAVAVLTILPLAAIAAELDFTPRVELGQNWTDNVALAGSAAEESEWITELSPGFTLSLTGPKLTADLDYQMQILRFNDNSQLNEVFNRLDASGKLELLPESAFVDAFARYDQQNVDTQGRQAFSNLFATDNRTDYAVVGISPYYQGNWGSWGESLVRLTAYGIRYGNTDSGATQPVDSDNVEVAGTLGSPEGSSGLNWRVSGSFTGTDFDMGRDFKYSQAYADLSVPLGFRSRLTARAGAESDVAEDSADGGLDESLWMLGFIWKPSELQSLEVRGGDRFYGSAWEASWQRRGSKGELAVDYTEQPTTSSGVLGDDELFLPGFPTIDIGSLDNRVFLQKRLSGNASYEFTRSVLAARVYSDRREFLDMLGGEEDSVGFTVSYDWEAAARTRVGTTVNIEERDFESGRTDEYGEFSVRATRQINNILSAELRISHILRNSDVETDYNANLVALYVTATFGGDEDYRRR